MDDICSLKSSELSKVTPRLRVFVFVLCVRRIHSQNLLNNSALVSHKKITDKSNLTEYQSITV